jgi:hypothetical protein
MKKTCISILAAAAVFSISQAHADTLADWTFETSQPNSTGPYSPEIGSGSGSVSGLGGSAVESSPAGNGSAHSFSANGWASGAAFDFQVSTLNYDDISVSYDQTGSSTGPKFFTFEYSVNGGAPEVVSSSYTVQVNGSPNTPWSSSGSPQVTYNLNYNLSADLDLDNAATINFFIVDASTTSLNGGTVASTGTDRVDNFMVSATPVPEPATLALCGIGGLAGLLILRRKR